MGLRRRRLADGAFTLVELCLVLLILGVAAALVVPRIQGGALERRRLRSASSRIASMASYARACAASKRRMHLFHVDVEEGTYWVTTGAGGVATRGDMDPRWRGRLPEGVRFLDAQTPADVRGEKGVVTLRFSPQGWADPAAIYLTAGDGETNTVLIRGFLRRVETYDTLVGLDQAG